MMKIDILPLGSYQTNCYIVRDEASATCAVIDPGFEPERILARLSQLGLTPDAILLTHGHFDHVGAVEDLINAAGCALWISQKDHTQPNTAIHDYLYPRHDKASPVASFCKEGDQIVSGGLTFTVLETPGHTQGSICYLCGDAMFCGDTLFAGACGRTDLPGGDRVVMANTLDQLSRSEEDFRLFPGHGEHSTLRHEQQTNPYLGGWL